MSSRLAFIEPQLPTLVEQPPTGSGWIHEIKHDGYRTLLVIAGRSRRAFTRNGFDWSDRYQHLIDATAKLRCRCTIIDGEVIVQDDRGVSDFNALKAAIRHEPQRLILYAFDLLHLNGHDLRKEQLIERRAKLKELIGSDPSSSARSPLTAVLPCSKPVWNMGWKASCQSWRVPATKAVVPRLGSRLSASRRAPS
jgi:bifunctional non-homologous end joining protein LigD